MAQSYPLVGRDAERAVLAEHASRARRGEGSIVLLSGEAGIGKTALVRAMLGHDGTERVEGFAVPGGDAESGPLGAVLRKLGGTWPPSISIDDPLPSALRHDETQLLAAIGSVVARAARDRPLALVFDDMHWADAASLRLVGALARSLEAEPVLLCVAYRDEGPARVGWLRQLRAQLRHEERLSEIALVPLRGVDTAALLEIAAGEPVDPSLAQAVHARADGVPFFVVELAAAIARSDRRRRGPAGLQWAAGEPLPLPESVRDAVLLRAAGLSDEARQVLDVVAVAGHVLGAELAPVTAGVIAWPDDLLCDGMVRETPTGELAFRHAIVRDAVYAELSGAQRLELHADLARRLEDGPASHGPAAEHWVLAGEPEAARRSLSALVDECLAEHRYADGVRAARRILELSGRDEPMRLDALERLARCASLAGDPRESARAWREIAEGCADVEPLRCAEAWRQHAAQREIQGRWEDALAARQVSAVAFAQAGALDEAAAERLAAAAHLRSAASYRAALALLQPAAADAAQTERIDLQLRIQALEGNVRARMGDAAQGVELVRGALTGALSANLSTVAAEIYQRLADSLEHRGDYAAARATYDDAAAFCNARGARPMAELCLACLAVVLRQAGDWPRATAAAREVMASPTSVAHARAAAGCTLGVIDALRGDIDCARAQLLDSASVARGIELTAGEILCLWGLAIVDDVSSAPEDQVCDACHRLIDRWQESEDRHYSISPLRWAVTALAERREVSGARACAAALTRIASEAGQPEAMSALSHALAETAMLDGDHERAITHFEQAIELLHEIGAPLERMESERRAAVALVLMDRRDEAVDRLLTAYRLGRRLRVRPSVERLAADLAALGERVDRRLSRLQAAQLTHAQLTRREVEVIRLLAQGHTNREIAAMLVLSVRTVDMHVRNILRKLDCRSRVDAARRAGELGLAAADSP